MRVGLIVNPVAGMGGRLALKGSDDRALLEVARARGAAPVSPARALDTLRLLAGAGREFELIAGPGPLGEDEARQAGLDPVVVVGPESLETTADDTIRTARAMADAGAELLVFAGGDGTAVDVMRAIGSRIPVLGIPAGVKMHSAVFALTPRHAAELVLAVVRGRARQPVEAEVMDVDEDALRAGAISPRLHGYLLVPVEPALVQSGKARSGPGEQAAQAGIAGHVIDYVLDDRLCLIGPGTTARAIMRGLGLEKTVLGVDVVRGRELVAADADEARLLELTARADARIVVTPVGGQGFVFGRGNQQLSARVIEQVGCRNVTIVATEAKLAALGGRPLLVDTGDPAVDRELSGYVRVVTGYNRWTVYPVAA